MYHLLDGCNYCIFKTRFSFSRQLQGIFFCSRLRWEGRRETLTPELLSNRSQVEVRGLLHAGCGEQAVGSGALIFSLRNWRQLPLLLRAEHFFLQFASVFHFSCNKNQDVSFDFFSSPLLKPVENALKEGCFLISLTPMYVKPGSEWASPSSPSTIDSYELLNALWAAFWVEIRREIIPPVLRPSSVMFLDLPPLFFLPVKWVHVPTLSTSWLVVGVKYGGAA